MELPCRCQVKMAHEIIAHFIGQQWVVELHPGDTRERSLHKVFKAGLGGSSQRNGVTIATEAGGDPENFDLLQHCLAASMTVSLTMPNISHRS